MRHLSFLPLVLILSACETDENPKSETGDPANDTGEQVVNPGSRDADGDGYFDDCDDNNPDVHPGAAEYCDGLDNDCNEVIDDNALDATAWYLDSDGDGYGDSEEETFSCEAPLGHVLNEEDCDDTDARFNPGAIESDCEDPNDYNCDGSVGYADDDGDGYAACAECDDSEEDVNPEADEVCNDIDDDCDGFIDADDPDLLDGTTFYGDSDGDGHGGQQYEAHGCEAPPGYVDSSDDCDDLEELTYPGASEVCDEEDNDCDGTVDEGVGNTWFADSDGDGYGDASTTSSDCTPPPGYSVNGDDCDDNDPSAHPGGLEVCDGVDNDCDGTADDASALDASTWYTDADGDGYGDASASAEACSASSGQVDNGSDCDDTSAAIHPAAAEICDGSDNNCDGSTDDASATDATTWYADSDSDSYGNSADSQVACSAPSGHVADSSDCDDTNSGVHPTATETCNELDDNCDGATDEGVLSTFYADFDSDGYGSPNISQEACAAPAAYVTDNTDCDDVDGNIHPGGTEICDATNDDEDCDGFADDADPQGATGTTLYYPDADSDGYGDSSDSGTAWCDPPSGIVSDNTDCNDTSTGADISPGAAEVCDSVDSDCDGNLDDPGQDDCHTLASCNDSGSGYACTCDSGYDGDGTSACEIDTFPDSVLLNLTQKSQLNTWASRSGQVWTLCYRKSDDGTSSSTFHSQCNSHSTTFTVADLSTGKLIGGYATTSWAGSGSLGNSSNFLFSLTNGYKIQHCTGQHGCGTPQYNVNHYGPTFGGGHDWHVADGMNGGYCNLGHDYACQVGSYSSSSCRNDFCGNYESWTINDIEVWGL